MKRVLSVGLGRVLEHLAKTSALDRGRQSEPSVAHLAPEKGKLPTGQLRVLEHVAATSSERHLRMPR